MFATEDKEPIVNNKEISNSHIFLCLSVFLAACVSAFFFKNRKIYKKKGPLLVPHSLFHVLREISGSQAPQYLLNLSKEYGPIFALRIPQLSPFCVVTCPKVARLVLEGDKSLGIRGADKGNAYKILSRMTDGHDTIFTKKTEGEGWGDARKGCAPSFSKPNIERLFPTIKSKISEFCDILGSFADSGQPCEHIETWFVRLTIDFISTTMLGVDFNTLGDKCEMEDMKVFLNELPSVIHEVALKQVVNPLRSLCFWIPEVRKAKKSARKLITVAKQILQQRATAQTTNDGECLLIDRMLKIPYKSDEERAADLVTMIIAGHDTTAFQLSWAMIEISRHEQVKCKLQLELDNAMPHEGDSLTADLITSLSYLDFVVKEIMRLWPVAAQGSIRIAPCDIILENCTIPKGATVLFPFYAMFRTADIQSAEMFIPERWSELQTDADAKKLEEVFIPFSAGKRNCVGQNLATWEMKHVIATIFHKFDLEFIGDVQTNYFLTLRPVNANFKVTRRMQKYGLSS